MKKGLCINTRYKSGGNSEPLCAHIEKFVCTKTVQDTAGTGLGLARW